MYSRLEKAAVPAGGPTTTWQLGLEDRDVVAIDAAGGIGEPRPPRSQRRGPRGRG